MSDADLLSFQNLGAASVHPSASVIRTRAKRQKLVEDAARGID